jgi:hypothetical protein
MDNQQAIDDALDKLEIENDDAIVEEVVVEEIKEEDAKILEFEEHIAEPNPIAKKENPPGYIDNVEDWVAAGKDPKLFKSPELYSAEYERIQKIKDLEESMQTVIQGVSEWKEQQQQSMAQQLEQARTEAQAEFEQAKEDDDVDAVIVAKDKLHNLDKPKQEAYRPNPVLTEFYSKNPILDKNSPQFDEEVFQDASMYQAAILNELTGGNQQIQLSTSQIERSLKVALNKAKALSPDKFVSPRNKRKAAPVTNRAKVQQQGGDYTSRLSSVKSNTMNKHDTSAGVDVYNMLKDKAEAIKDPVAKAKALKAAETYAKTVLGD